MFEAIDFIFEHYNTALCIWFELSIFFGLATFIIIKIIDFIFEHYNMKENIEELNNKVEKLEKRKSKK